MAWEASQADLERALGGADVLAQLADSAGTGPADQATVRSYLDDGAAEVRELVQRKYDDAALQGLDARSSQRLKAACAALAARVAWTQGARGEAMPARLDEAAVRAETWAREVGDGARTLGIAAGGNGAAAINNAVGVIDSDPLGTGLSIAGLKRGFL